MLPVAFVHGASHTPKLPPIPEAEVSMWRRRRVALFNVRSDLPLPCSASQARFDEGFDEGFDDTVSRQSCKCQGSVLTLSNSRMPLLPKRKTFILPKGKQIYRSNSCSWLRCWLWPWSRDLSRWRDHMVRDNHYSCGDNRVNITAQIMATLNKLQHCIYQWVEEYGVPHEFDALFENALRISAITEVEFDSLTDQISRGVASEAQLVKEWRPAVQRKQLLRWLVAPFIEIPPWCDSKGPCALAWFQFLLLCWVLILPCLSLTVIVLHPSADSSPGVLLAGILAYILASAVLLPWLLLMCSTTPDLVSDHGNSPKDTKTYQGYQDAPIAMVLVLSFAFLPGLVCVCFAIYTLGLTGICVRILAVMLLLWLLLRALLGSVLTETNVPRNLLADRPPTGCQSPMPRRRELTPEGLDSMATMERALEETLKVDHRAEKATARRQGGIVRQILGAAGAFRQIGPRQAAPSCSSHSVPQFTIPGGNVDPVFYF